MTLGMVATDFVLCTVHLTHETESRTEDTIFLAQETIRRTCMNV